MSWKNHKITDIGEPTELRDAVMKHYVDQLFKNPGGLSAGFG